MAKNKKKKQIQIWRIIFCNISVGSTFNGQKNKNDNTHKYKTYTLTLDEQKSNPKVNHK